MIETHPDDSRSAEEQLDDLISLNLIQGILEHEISSYAIENSENLFDDEYQQILRKIEFSRGLKTHQLVIAPDAFIRGISPGFPNSLLQQIHYALVDLLSARDDRNTPSAPLPDRS